MTIAMVFCAVNAQAGVLGQIDKLLPSDGTEGDQFGRSVALSGNIALVGAPYDDNGTNSGSAYLIDVTTGEELLKLVAADGAGSFGKAVALNGNLALIGASQTPGSGGCAYLFNVTTGEQLQKLTPSDPEANNQFGGSVALSGNLALIGASGKEYNNVCAAGSASVFDVTTGAQLRQIYPSYRAKNQFFGYSVALSGDIAVIGAYGDDNISGSAYVFDVTRGRQLYKNS